MRTDRQTDRQTDMRKLIVAFCNAVKAPKMNFEVLTYKYQCTDRAARAR
jgi:hypothetical protein